MPGRTRQNLPAPIARLARRLEAHRKIRRRPRALPEKFWRRAARLAGKYGVCRVQQALRLNYHDLKRRQEQRSERAAKRVRPAFVELQVARCSPVLGVAVLELEDGRGRKLTVRLATEDNGKLAAAAAALWGCSA